MSWIFLGAVLGAVPEIVSIKVKPNLTKREMLESGCSFMIRLTCSTIKWAAIFGFAEWLKYKVICIDDALLIESKRLFK